MDDICKKYIVAGCKPWARRHFEESIASLPGDWSYVDTPDALAGSLTLGKPRYIFFMHWSWKVPESIINEHECVCFHMTDVPYGRGGSPLQNLIVRGNRETKISALRMTVVFDAGPVYFKESLSLEGGAEEIYLRASRITAAMITRMVKEEPVPRPQEGKVVVFKRRKPADSEMIDIDRLESMHDFIRMLDADGYPAAYLMHGKFKYQFTRSTLYNGKIVAEVTITHDDKE